MNMETSKILDMNAFDHNSVVEQSINDVLAFLASVFAVE